MSIRQQPVILRDAGSGQLFHQRLGFLQVPGIKPFSEPAIGLCQHLVSFFLFAWLLLQTGQAYGCPELQRLRLLPTSYLDGCLKTRFGLRLRIADYRLATWDLGLGTAASALQQMSFVCPEGLQYGVGGGITNGEKPGPTTEVMVPPLFLHPGFILARVQVVSPLARGSHHLRPLANLSAKTELVDTSFSTIGAA